jgi:cytochrome c biogenesis protein CcdA
MLAVLSAGFVLGLRHALEPDHLSVVSVLAARRDPARGFLRHGLIWSLGHSLSLLALALVVVLAGRSPPANWDRTLHVVIGLLLLALGIGALLRGLGLARRTQQPTLASSAEASGSAATPESPAHARTLLIGLVQGLAGSGGLVLLAIDAAGRPALAIGYVAVFGLGSIAGMALVALALRVPLTRATQRVANFTRWMSLIAGALMVVVALQTLRGA